MELRQNTWRRLVCHSSGHRVGKRFISETVKSTTQLGQFLSNHKLQTRIWKTKIWISFKSSGKLFYKYHGERKKKTTFSCGTAECWWMCTQRAHTSRSDAYGTVWETEKCCKVVICQRPRTSWSPEIQTAKDSLKSQSRGTKTHPKTSTEEWDSLFGSYLYENKGLYNTSSLSDGNDWCSSLFPKFWSFLVLLKHDHVQLENWTYRVFLFSLYALCTWVNNVMWKKVQQQHLLPSTASILVPIPLTLWLCGHFH